MTSHRLIALISALALLVTACGGATNDSADGADATPWPGTHVDEADAVTEALDGPNLAVLEQGSLEGMDVVVWFWAEW